MKDRTGSWLNEPEEETAQGRLSATGFADETQGLTFADAQIHAIHRTNCSEVAACGKVFVEVTGLDQDNIGGLGGHFGTITGRLCGTAALSHYLLAQEWDADEASSVVEEVCASVEIAALRMGRTQATP